jgi:flagellar motor switch/type III secretory pathway protein FliN
VIGGIAILKPFQSNLPFPGHLSAVEKRMEATTALPPQAEPTEPVETGDAARQALIRSPQSEDMLFASNTPAARLPVELDVAVPLRDFRVKNLLALAPGAVVESQWGHAEDVPLSSGDVQLAWTEFEVIETQLAVRLTRLA